MAVMKATLHMGRLKGKSKGSHNDHTYDTDKNASIVHPEFSKYNQYYVTDERGRFHEVEAGQGAFEKREREFYRDHFSKGQEAKNRRYKADGHKDRCRSITAVRKNPKTAPMEIILQVGGKDTPYEDPSGFAQMVRQFVAQMRAKYPQWRALNMAIHYDEKSFHAHIRGVFVARDEYGYEVPNQTKALQDMGFERPDPTSQRGQKNNELISFTAGLRDEWYDIIEGRDATISIDRKPVKGQRHQSHKNRTKDDLDAITKQYDAVRRNLIQTDWARLEMLEAFVEEKGLGNAFEDFSKTFDSEVFLGR